LASLQPKHIIAIDFSRVSLTGAQETCRGLTGIEFLRTNATAIALRANIADLVVERAVIHHMSSLDENFAEILRVLKPGGSVWVQDRTHSDLLRRPSVHHLRGYYLQYFPQLKELELRRRYDLDVVLTCLTDAGFRRVRAVKLVETRKVFQNAVELREEIVSRRGRSVLHALSDAELEYLATRTVEHIRRWPVVERDRWTVWTGVKPR
jgi:ubiquinone/menaquinone biosynthesis C-methylase UbiE